MAAAGGAVVVRGTHARRAATLLRGDVRGILEDVVDRYELGLARRLSLERRWPLGLAGRRVARIRHEHRGPALALRRGCAHRGRWRWSAMGVQALSWLSCSQSCKVRPRHVIASAGAPASCSPRLHMPTAGHAIGRPLLDCSKLSCEREYYTCNCRQKYCIENYCIGTLCTDYLLTDLNAMLSRNGFAATRNQLQ